MNVKFSELGKRGVFKGTQRQHWDAVPSSSGTSYFPLNPVHYDIVISPLATAASTV